MNGIIEAIDRESLKENVPAFNVGDTVKVSVKVIEGTRERIQGFEGVVIAKKGGGIGETFTVRRVSFGVGVERTFPRAFPQDHRYSGDQERAGQARKTLLSQRAYG